MLSLTRTRLGPRGGETYQLDFVFCDIAMFEPLDQMTHADRWPSLTSARYAVADIALLTPLIDGVNLVAKEYLACQTEQRGLLTLSEFAGAAPGTLTEALRLVPERKAVAGLTP